MGFTKESLITDHSTYVLCLCKLLINLTTLLYIHRQIFKDWKTKNCQPNYWQEVSPTLVRVVSSKS